MLKVDDSPTELDPQVIVAERRATAAVQSRLLSEFLTSGVSVAIANTSTNPIDVVKTRLQLQARQSGGAHAPGMFRTGVNIVRQEGVLALWNGLTPALARGLVYGGARLGLYSPFRQLLSGDDAKPSFGAKLAAGVASGGMAAAVTNPIELVKTRLQSGSGGPTTSLGVVRQVLAERGVVGLWTGALPGTARAMVLTASQCATYDEVKRRVMAATGWHDSLATHLTASMVTGLVTTTITNPVDVVKTIMFAGDVRGSGPVAVTAHLWRTEGVRGLFKGWTANYSRLGPQTVIIFLVAENLRRLAGLSSL